MQPYFFPYLGHFSLIAACDVWVVFDISQYTPRTWVNRNRVLHPASGSAYVTVPLAGGSIHMQTRAARLVAPATARRSVHGAISHYRRQAPYHDEVSRLVDEAFETCPSSLVDLNVRALRAVCGYLGLPFRVLLSSDLDLEPTSNLGPGDWAPMICSAIQATEYLNPVGGAGLFEAATFARRGVELRFLEVAPFTYRTGTFEFVPNLSILDVLMWNDPAEVRRVLRAHARVLVPEDA